MTPIHINELPDEILEFIFSHLPPYNDLRSCSVVCKRWTQLVKNVWRHTDLNFLKGLTDFRLCWKPLDSVNDSGPTVAGRFSHSAVVHNNSMYVFGGGSSTNTTFNDLWRFDLSKREWIRPLTMGTYPSPKACASMVCHNDTLILFGGWRHPSSYPPYQPWRLFDELHVYHIAENKWTSVTTVDGPPQMTGHSASVHENTMLIFGGYTCVDGVPASINDVWSLDLTSFTWTKRATTSPKPPPRYGQFQIVLDETRCLVMGGCGGPNNIFSDAWILEMSEPIWKWQIVNVKNKKWGSTHMWCNPACKVGNKIVVLGPVASVTSDFQMVRHQMPSTSRNNLPRHDNNQFQGNPAQPMPQPANVHNNIPRQQPPANNAAPPANERNGPNGGAQENGANIEDDAANRLQRNLQLRCRRSDNDEYNLPKRFEDALPPVQDRIPMAAFNVQQEPIPSTASPRERRLESLRRMEEKMQAMRRVVQPQADDIAAPPKRIKRNCIGMFVCDINEVLYGYEPTLEWIEYKNYGIIHDAPDRLILSSLVTGNGELIMFGGLRKEPNPTSNTMQVSNSIHFLRAPSEII